MNTVGKHSSLSSRSGNRSAGTGRSEGRELWELPCNINRLTTTPRSPQWYLVFVQLELDNANKPGLRKGSCTSNTYIPSDSGRTKKSYQLSRLLERRSTRLQASQTAIRPTTTASYRSTIPRRSSSSITLRSPTSGSESCLPTSEKDNTRTWCCI